MGRLGRLLAKCACADGAAVLDAATPKAVRVASDVKLNGTVKAVSSRERWRPYQDSAMLEDITLTVDSLPNSSSQEPDSSDSPNAVLNSSDNVAQPEQLTMQVSSTPDVHEVSALDEDKAALLEACVNVDSPAAALVTYPPSRQQHPYQSPDVANDHLCKGADEDNTVEFKPTGAGARATPREVEPTPRLIVGSGMGSRRAMESSVPDAPVFCPIAEDTVPEPVLVDGAEVLTLDSSDVGGMVPELAEVVTGHAADDQTVRPPAVFTMIPMASSTYQGATTGERPATPTSPYRLPVFAAPIQTRIPRTPSRPGTPNTANTPTATTADPAATLAAAASQLSSPCATVGTMTPPGSALSRIPSAPKDFILRPSSPAQPADLYSAMSDAAYLYAAGSIANTPLSTASAACGGSCGGSVFGGGGGCCAADITVPASPSAASTTAWYGATSSVAVSRCSTPCSLSSTSMLVRGASGRFVLAPAVSRIPACPAEFPPGVAPASPGNLRPTDSRIPSPISSAPAEANGDNKSRPASPAPRQTARGSLTKRSGAGPSSSDSCSRPRAPAPLGPRASFAAAAAAVARTAARQRPRASSRPSSANVSRQEARAGTPQRARSPTMASRPAEPTPASAPMEADAALAGAEAEDIDVIMPSSVGEEEERDLIIVQQLDRGMEESEVPLQHRQAKEQEQHQQKEGEGGEVELERDDEQQPKESGYLPQEPVALVRARAGASFSD